MFLTITNDGLAPVESFTVLGLSTARGNADKIGQFGSGAKHGILTCLRNHITPQVWIGLEPLEFATERGEMSGKAYDRVLYSWRGQIERSSMVLEFGSLDWTKLEMGLREFVCNALDSVDNDATRVGIKIVDKPQPKDNATTIAIPLTPTVEQFAQSLTERFLQFRQDYDASAKILMKETPSACRYYRKGVYVRESAISSLYDYNLGDDSKIDESRNLSDTSVAENVARLWRGASAEQLADIFSKIDKCGDKIMELSFYYWNLEPQSKEDKTRWLAAWKSTFGDYCVANANDTGTIQFATKRNISFKIMPECWARALISAGVKTLQKGLDENGFTKDGKQTKPASATLIARCQRIWDKLEQKGLTNGATFPRIAEFTEIASGGEKTCGYYDRATRTVYIESEHKTNKQTILEELAHHITQAADNTRDFQEYAFKVAATFLR